MNLTPTQLFLLKTYYSQIFKQNESGGLTRTPGSPRMTTTRYDPTNSGRTGYQWKDLAGLPGETYQRMPGQTMPTGEGYYPTREQQNEGARTGFMSSPWEGQYPFDDRSTALERGQARENELLRNPKYNEAFFNYPVLDAKLRNQEAQTADDLKQLREGYIRGANPAQAPLPAIPSEYLNRNQPEQSADLRTILAAQKAFQDRNAPTPASAAPQVSPNDPYTGLQGGPSLTADTVREALAPRVGEGWGVGGRFDQNAISDQNPSGMRAYTPEETAERAKGLSDYYARVTPTEEQFQRMGERAAQAEATANMPVAPTSPRMEAAYDSAARYAEQNINAPESAFAPQGTGRIVGPAQYLRYLIDRARMNAEDYRPYAEQKTEEAQAAAGGVPTPEAASGGPTNPYIRAALGLDEMPWKYRIYPEYWKNERYQYETQNATPYD
jgi:hypothetical protein